MRAGGAGGQHGAAELQRERRGRGAELGARRRGAGGRGGRGARAARRVARARRPLPVPRPPRRARRAGRRRAPPRRSVSLVFTEFHLSVWEKPFQEDVGISVER